MQYNPHFILRQCCNIMQNNIETGTNEQKFFPGSCLTESKNEAVDQRDSSKAGVYCRQTQASCSGRGSKWVVCPPSHPPSILLFPLYLLKAYSLSICAALWFLAFLQRFILHLQEKDPCFKIPFSCYLIYLQNILWFQLAPGFLLLPPLTLST